MQSIGAYTISETSLDNKSSGRCGQKPVLIPYLENGKNNSLEKNLIFLHSLLTERRKKFSQTAKQ